MSEVSCRPLQVYLAALRESGTPIHRFIEGLNITEAQVQNPRERIGWDDFLLLSERLEKICGGAEGIEEAGARFLEVPTWKALTSGLSLLANVRSLYWLASRWVAPRMFGPMASRFEVVGPRQVRIIATIPAPHRWAPAFFRINGGCFRAAPRALGQPDAIVKMTITERTCVYDIEHAASMTIWTRLRHAFLAVFAAGRIFEELQTQNDDLHRSLIELTKARQAAEAASAVKTQFIANVGHELRTPLNGMIGMSELLREHALPPQAAELARGVHSSASTLLGLINDVLDLSELDAGRLAIQRSDFELSNVLGAARDQIAAHAQQKQLSLECAIDSKVPLGLYADEQRIGRVLLNLMSNAVKFTEMGGVEVRVALEHEDPKTLDVVLRFSVRDTGIGIPLAAREKLFDSFVQADGSMTRKHGGLGLGLSIARQLVERMGGRLGCESEEGSGSTFWFTVPCRRSTKLGGREAGRFPGREPGREPGRLLSPVAALEPVTVAPAPQPVREKPECAIGHLLIAEDNLVNQKILARMLEKLGYDVDLACNGREAVAAVERSSYDAILMDIQMPEMDGFEATVLIRRREENTRRHTPIIAVTAHSEKEFVDRAVQVGMDAHLSKPIQRELVADTLARFMNRSPAAQLPN